MSERLGMNEKFEEMPERTWLSSPSLAFENALGCWFSSRRGVAPHEYTRSDLVPSWHERPTCAGLWLVSTKGSRGVVVLVSDADDVHNAPTFRWYGPIPEIPEDKR